MNTDNMQECLEKPDKVDVLCSVFSSMKERWRYMNISNIQKNWEKFGQTDALYAILSHTDKKGNKWDIKEFFDTGKVDIQNILDLCNDSNCKINFKRALDFGCGAGRLTQALSDKFQKVVGIDISYPMIDLANKYNKYGNKCKYIVNTKDNLEIFSDNSFDFILTLIVLQHNPQKAIKNYIKEFIRILDKGGILVFQLPYAAKNPLKSSIKAQCKKIINIISLKPVMEINYINNIEIIKLIKNSGGKIINIIEDTKPEPDFKSYKYIVSK